MMPSAAKLYCAWIPLGRTRRAMESFEYPIIHRKALFGKAGQSWTKLNKANFCILPRFDKFCQPLQRLKPELTNQPCSFGGPLLGRHGDLRGLCAIASADKELSPPRNNLLNRTFSGHSHCQFPADNLLVSSQLPCAYRGSRKKQFLLARSLKYSSALADLLP